MPLIFEKPNLLNSITPSVEAFQQQRFMEEQARAQERIRQRQLLTAGLGAAAGAGIGLLAAPALGLAGQAAGATAADGISSLAYGTAGPLGFGGQLSGMGALTAGLQGAALGSNVAQGMQSGDLAGPLGAVAGAVGQANQAAQDYQTYGFSPTDAERATFAQTAARAGTNIGSIRQLAAQQGITVPEALAQAQRSAELREVEQQYQMAFAQTRGRADAELNSLPGWESQPDTNEILRLQSDMQAVDSDYAQGHITFEEAIPKWNALQQKIAYAKQGSMRPKPPSMPRFDSKGNMVGEWGPGIYDNGDGTMTAIERDRYGQMSVKWKGEPAKKNPPIRIRQADGNVLEVDADIYEDAKGNKYTREGIKVDRATDRDKARSDYILKHSVDNEGFPLGQEAIAQLGANYDAVIRSSEIGDDILAMHKDLGSVTPDKAAILYREWRALNPNPSAAEQTMMADITNAVAAKQAIQQQQMMIAAQRQNAAQRMGLVGPPMNQQQAAQPPPRGSAAAAEETGRAAARAVKAAPATIGSVAKRTAEGALNVATNVADATARGAGGFMQEMFGGESKSPSGRRHTYLGPSPEEIFEQVQRQNIEAGIDEPITAIHQDGRRVQIVKGQLTAEKLAELRQLGFTVPGLE